VKKAIYVIRGTDSETYPNFRARVLELARLAEEEADPRLLKVTLTVSKPPRMSVIPFRRTKVAAISIRTGAPAQVTGLSQAEGFFGGYLVDEAIPVAYEKTWSDGIMTPGVCLLTLFHRRSGLDESTFLHRWHNGHTPLSLRLHPLWNYNRNVVTNIKEGSISAYDGIVEEHFRKRSDLLNPLRFFGPPIKVPVHMMQVWIDSRSFIDMKRIEVYLAAEYILRS
jgi:hypothetical protein